MAPTGALVGLTTYREPARWGAWDRPAVLLPTSYADCVAAVGGRPVLLPAADGPGADPATAAAAVAALDALVLVGGGDVDPARYGQVPGPATGGVDPRRDANEAALLGAALERDLPVLAICRGMQLLNVELGGSLHQHLPDRVGHHGHQPRRGCFADVTVRTVPGSALAEVLGAETPVRCSHHQALDAVAAGLAVTATAEDGTVEGVEMAGRRFVVGVQWHPEEQGDLRLFAALLAAGD